MRAIFSLTAWGLGVAGVVFTMTRLDAETLAARPLVVPALLLLGLGLTMNARKALSAQG